MISFFKVIVVEGDRFVYNNLPREKRNAHQRTHGLKDAASSGSDVSLPAVVHRTYLRRREGAVVDADVVDDADKNLRKIRIRF